MSLSSLPDVERPPLSHPQPVRRRRRRSRWSRFKRRVRHLRRDLPSAAYVVGGVVILFLLLCGVRAATARRELKAAEHDFTDAKTAVAETRTQDAAKSLDDAEHHLHAARAAANAFPLGLTRPIPLVGSASNAAVDVSRAGDELVAAGRIVNAAAASFPTSGQIGVDGHDLSAFHDAAVRSTDALRIAHARIERAQVLVNGPTGAFLPPVSKPARGALQTITASVRQLEGATRGLRLLAELTAPTAHSRLLVLSQDTMELRPTGGFVGSYGVLELDGGHVQLTDFKATEDLPPPARQVPVPPQFDRAQWGVENAMWWPDFPTSAAAAVNVFEAQGGEHVDGVLAIDENVMADLVGAFGPVSVPGYSQPVTGPQLADRVLYEVELKRPQDTPRKLFLSRLAGVVINRALALTPHEVPRVTKILGRRAGDRSLQLWFADHDRQRLITKTSVAGELPKTADDFLMLVESNQTASKANRDLERQVTYRVTNDGDQLVGHLEIDYRNGGAASAPNPYYNGYLRVYVPRGSRPLRSTASLAGRAPDGPYDVLERSVYVKPGAESVVTIDYDLPNEIRASHYRLLWVRQPGTQDDSAVSIGGKTTSMAADAQQLTARADLAENRVRRYLRTRWIGRFFRS